MNNLINWLENSFAPKMNKFNHNTSVVTIKDSIMQVLPFYPAGIPVLCGNGYRRVCDSALFLLDTLWVDNGNDFCTCQLSLIPFNFCEKKRLRKQSIIGRCNRSDSILYIHYSGACQSRGNRGLVASAFGAGGMFCAMFTGILTQYCI